MSPPIRIVSPELTVPVLDAPRLKPIDVSSGLESVAGGLEDLARAHKITEVNDAQIGFTNAFRDLDASVRQAPWDEKQPLFDEHAATIRRQYLDPVTGRQQRQALEPEFDRTVGIYQAHTAHDAFRAEAAHNIAAAGIATGKIAAQVAIARSPQEREMLVGQATALNDHLAIGGFINEDQRQQANQQFLNQADVASVQAALDDPNRDPSALARTLMQRKQYFHLDRDQVSNFAKLARNEAIRRDGLAAANANVDAAALQQQAPKIVHDNVLSLLTTGRPVADGSLAALDRLPSDQQPKYRDAIDGASQIFGKIGDMRTLPPDKIASALDQLKPLGAGIHAQAQDLANRIMADRASDPARAMRESVPTVADAWAAYEANAAPENLQAAAKLSQAAQTALGIPSGQQRVLPNDLAESEARTILSTAPADQLTALRDLKSRYGTYAPNVLPQVNPLLSPQLRQAAAQSSSLAGDLVWRRAVAEAGANGPVPDVEQLRSATFQLAANQPLDAQSGAANGTTPTPDLNQVATNGTTDASSPDSATTVQAVAALGAQPQSAPTAPPPQSPGNLAQPPATPQPKYNEVAPSQVPQNPNIIPPASGDAPWKLTPRKNILVPADHLDPGLRAYLDSLDWSNPTDDLIRGPHTPHGGGGFYDLRAGKNHTHWYHGSLDIMSIQGTVDSKGHELTQGREVTSPVTGTYVGNGSVPDEGHYIELDLGRSVHIRVFHVNLANAPFSDKQPPHDVLLRQGDIVRSGETIGTQEYFGGTLAGTPIHAHVQIMLETSPRSGRYFLIDPSLFIHNPQGFWHQGSFGAPAPTPEIVEPGNGPPGQPWYTGNLLPH